RHTGSLWNRLRAPSGHTTVGCSSDHRAVGPQHRPGVEDRMKNESVTKINLRRRELLAGTASLLLGMSHSRAAVIFDHLPWAPNAGNPPTPAKPGPWLFFTGPEGRAMEAIAHRISPPDPHIP